MTNHLFGIAITGLLGSGKSTIARCLSGVASMTIIRTVVTRKLETGEEDEFLPSSVEDFIRQSKDGRIVLPFFFGGNWYGYYRQDWERAVESSGAGFIFNVRPYIGLVISSFLERVYPVWIDLQERVRIERIRKRSANRDSTIERSPELDEKDKIYKAVYPYIFDATDTSKAVQEILSLIHSGEQNE